MTLQGNEASISEATNLRLEDGNYFKGMVIDRQLCQQFLVLKHSNPNWTKGIPCEWIKPEYCTMIVSLQRFLTCEGRYAITFLYHLRLLLRFEGGPKLNFPYFL